jgi:hypothetical protein
MPDAIVMLDTVLIFGLKRQLKRDGRRHPDREPQAAEKLLHANGDSLDEGELHGCKAEPSS